MRPPSGESFAYYPTKNTGNLRNFLNPEKSQRCLGNLQKMPFRILVDDKDAAVQWYADCLGFSVAEEWGPAFAILELRGDRLWVSGPQTSAAKPMPDGSQPAPGGWNRIVVQVEDFEQTLALLKSRGAKFRNEPITGPGGTQVLVEDPSGNPVEVFSSAQ